MSDFSYPDNMKPHIEKIFRGEYAVPLKLERPVILDIGANCGAFAWWALRYWPDSSVTCYEPNPAAFEFLEKNMGGLENVALHNIGIRASSQKQQFLHFGRHNLGEASFFLGPEQVAIGRYVECCHPDTLPPCDILKVDTEGCELEIIATYLTQLHAPKLILFEYHRESDRLGLDSLLIVLQYVLVGGEIQHYGRGLLKYAHRSTL